jgi:N-formylglutamate amidohydrolase
MGRQMARALAAILALLLAAGSAAHAQNDANRYVVAERGELPLILSAPHGGNARIPGVADRVRPEGAAAAEAAKWGGFHGGAGDVGTLELAQAVAARVKARLGRAPYVVLALAQRRNVDLNRPAHLAYDPPGDGGPKAIYDAYHRALAAFRHEVTQGFGRGLLLDIHGQGEARGTVFRGTVDTRAVAHLLHRHGQAALSGPDSIFGALAAKGYDVHPAIGSMAREDRRYSGGFITATYGSAGGGTLDAIQIEFGTDLRTKERRPQTAEDLAEAIVRFHGRYLAAAAR